MLTKEIVDSWYTPKNLPVTCECLSEEEELVAEDTCKFCKKIDCICEDDAMEREHDLDTRNITQ